VDKRIFVDFRIVQEKMGKPFTRKASADLSIFPVTRCITLFPPVNPALQQGTFLLVTSPPHR
jgi:hypothetical protein